MSDVLLRQTRARDSQIGATEGNRQVATEWSTRSMDAEAQAPLAEAEAWIRENA